MKSTTTVARPPREETPLETLLFDVEDRCGRAVLVSGDVTERLVGLVPEVPETPLLLAALEMITLDLNALATRTLEARMSGAKVVA